MFVRKKYSRRLTLPACVVSGPAGAAIFFRRETRTIAARSKTKSEHSARGDANLPVAPSLTADEIGISPNYNQR